MALKPPRVPRVDHGSSEPARPAQPIRPIWQGAGIWFVGIIVLLLAVGAAVRYLLLPALSGNPGNQSAAEAHLSALQTQEALAPQPTLVPTLAPTPLPAPAAKPTAAPTALPTAVQPTTTPASTPQPTTSPELVSQVSQAYIKYFQVRADALFNLDTSQLKQVAAGDALAGLQNEVDQDRAAGRAIRTDVAHNYNVISANSDDAQIADDYRDSSVFVDPATKEPLPGEVVPASPADAPEVRVVYQLHHFPDGWKVTGGQKYE